jgi:phosphoserine phosphatase
MPNVRWPLVTVDIDGTLTRGHGWATIADAFRRRAEFDRTQRRFDAKEIGEDEHLRDMLALAAGRTVREVEEALAATPRLQGIPEGVRTLHDRGRRVALLSHNPRYVGDWYQHRFGFDDFEGVEGQAVVDGVIGPAGPVRADKLAGLRALTARFAISPEDVVHVGDGWADAEVFAQVGAGIALNSRFPEVEAAADLVLRTDDFRRVAAAIDELSPRP